MTTPQDDPSASGDLQSHDVSSAIGLGLGLPEEAPILGQPLNLAHRRQAAPPSIASSSSRSKHADIELSLPTQRRLIRKPLPDVPPSSTSRQVSAASSSSNAQPVPHSPRPGTFYDEAFAENWWPDEIPTLPSNDPSTENDSPSQAAGPTAASLDAASQAHLHSFLFYALETDQGRLPASYHLALFSALLDALQSITDPAVFAGLQRTACIRWRAEAQLRAAAAKNGASARGDGSNLHLAPHGPSPSRWARLGWPAAALRGMMQIKSDATSTTTGPAQALEASLAESHHWKVSKEQRVRKRDVALAVLSNAVWLVSTYGSSDGTIDPAPSDTKRRSSATQPERHSPENVPRDTSRDRRLPTRRGGLPNFIPPSAPTTALSASASPSLRPAAFLGAERPTSLHLPSSSSLVSISAPSSVVATPSATVDAPSEGLLPAISAQQLPQNSPGLSIPGSRGSPTASVDISRPGTPAISLAGGCGSEGPATAPFKPASKAVEHLSSLNAAVGAAFKAQARAQAEKDGINPISGENSRTSSTARHLSAAEAAETAALEKAERDFIARVGADCEERAKMVLASIMIDVRIDDGTASNAEQTPIGSVLSTRSDRTIGAVTSDKEGTLTSGKALASDADSHWPVKWLPGTFRGENLYAESPRVRHSVESEQERLKLEGGTFSVLARTHAEGQLLKAALAAALYAACSMKLESELLRDIGYTRPQPQSRREASSGTDTAQHDEIPDQDSSDSKPMSKSADSAMPTQSSGRSNKRWTKGIWGILQSGSDVVHAALHASTSSPGKPTGTVPEEEDQGVTMPTPPNAGLPRSATVDGSERKRTTSLNLSRQSTKEAVQASQRRLPIRLSRFIHHFAGGGAAEGAAAKARGRTTIVEDSDPPTASTPSRASIDVPRHEETQEHLDRTRLFMGFLSGRSDNELPPLSTSPELSQVLASSYQDAEALRSIRGMAFLHRFMRAQALNVLVGGRNPLPISSYQLRSTTSQGYFNSVSSSTATPALPSRSVSGTSSVADSTISELSSIPGTPALPVPSAAAPKAGTDPYSSAVQKWTCLNRENVHFYRQTGSGRDIHLGQVIEDICSRVETIALQNEFRSKQVAESQQTSKKTDKRQSYQPLQHPTIHYLHGQYQITIAAQPVASYHPSLETGPLPVDAATSTAQGNATSGSSAVGPDKGATIGNAEASEADVDVLAVAATLSADRDAARTAVALAEGAIQAAESEQSSKPLPHSMIMWAANVHTGQQTVPKVVSDATWLMSFAQFLEATMYHPGFDQICAHPAGEADDGNQTTRFDLLRFFKKGDILAKVTVKPLTIFDLQTEGPVVLSRAARQALEGATPKPPESGQRQDVLEDTRLEIQELYASVKDQIAELEQIIVQRTLDEHGKTVKPKEGALRRAVAASESVAVSDADTLLDQNVSTADRIPDDGPLGLLTKLRTSFRENEFALYEAVKECDPRFINDVRKVFKDYSRSAQHRLAAWRKKHLTKEELSAHNNPPRLREPAYMGPKQHPFPGSQYVIREDEPLSIIAFSLSSRDFMGELRAAPQQRGQSKGGTGNVGGNAEPQAEDKMADVLQWRSGVSGGSLSSATSIPSRSDGAEEPSIGTGSQISTSYQSITSGLSMAHYTPKDRAPDPDKDSWFVDVEPVNVSMKRKKRGRDGSILSLSLRRVGSASAPSDQGGPTSVGEGNSEGDESFEDDFTFSASGLDPNMIDVGTGARTLNPPKPATKKVHGTSTISSTRTNSTFRAHVTQVSGRPQSLISMFTRDDGAASLSEISVDDDDDIDDDGSRTASQASSTKGKTNAETTAANKAGTTTADSQNPQARLGSAPAESPHVKHSLYHGSTKVSCVSWFAAEFAALRRRWGVEEDFVESLAHSRPWQTTGGKSRSHFFKTSDEKWVGKQLLTVWSVDEKDALLEFAPAYIRYMLNADANDCPSLLVKIAGFYSLKIKDVKRGETKLKMSVMILENLFADVKTRATRFDLKGIRDRRAPQGKSDRGQPGAPTPSASTPATPNIGGGGGSGGGFPQLSDAVGEEETPTAVHWDAEWIEQYASRAYVPESEQELFVQALRNDLSFLTESNVMDFSLLVGVTEAQHNAQGEQITAPTIRVRIVDYISAFTLAKQLESSSKKALKSSEARGNVTVLPPSEYAARFEAAMLSYFIGVPERHAGRKKAVNVERPLAVSSVL